MEQKNKNKLLKICIVFVVIISLFLIYDYTPLFKVPVSNMIFGQYQCTLEIQKNNGKIEDSEYVFPILDLHDRHSNFGGDAISTWKCRLCWRISKHSNTAVPMLCDLCARITNRCEKCADILDI